MSFYFQKIIIKKSIKINKGIQARNIELDLVRATAVTVVVAAHVFWNFLPPIGTTILLWSGEAGVELFFSLSGFLIGGILIVDAKNEFGPREIGAFLFRRWMRTLPIYYVALWVHSQFFGIENLHAYLFLQNFYPSEPRSMVVSWSLMMEEYFYVFFPLAMLLQVKVFGCGVRLVTLTSIELIVICTLGRLLYVHGPQHVPALVMHEHPFMRMDCAAYGVLAACLIRSSPRVISWMSAERCVWMFVAAVLSIVAWGALYTTLQHVPVDELVAWGFASWGPTYFAFQHSALNALFAVAISTTFFMRVQMPGFLVSFVQKVSLLSYSIYLFHTFVIGVMDTYLPGEQSLARAFLIIIVVLMVAAVTYYGIERPLLRLRDWVVPGRTTSTSNPGDRFEQPNLASLRRS